MLTLLPCSCPYHLGSSPAFMIWSFQHRCGSALAVLQWKRATCVVKTVIPFVMLRITATVHTRTHTHTHTQAHMHTRAGTLTQGWWNSNNVAPIIDRSDALTPSCFAQYATFQTDTKLQLWEKTRLRTERLGRQVATIGKIVIPWVVSCFLIQEQSRTSRIQKLMKLLWTRVGKLVWAILFISRTCIIFGGTPSCIGLTAIVRWPLPASSRAYQQTKTQGSTCPYWLLWYCKSNCSWKDYLI